MANAEKKQLYIKEQPRNLYLYALYDYPDDEHLEFCGTATELKEVLGDFRPYSSICRNCKSVIICGKRYILHRWKIKDLEKLEEEENGK